MRPDMKHVIQDVYARHEGCVKKGRYKDVDFEDRPIKESMSEGKNFGWDHKDRFPKWQPIDSYLRKQVGRNWNDIWADVCRVNDNKSVRGREVREQINGKWKLERNPVFLKGKVYYNQCRSYRKDLLELPNNYLYIDQDNILRLYKREITKLPDYLYSDISVVLTGSPLQYRKVNGVWYKVDVSKSIFRPRIVYGVDISYYYKDNPIALHGYFITCDLKNKFVSRKYFGDHCTWHDFDNKKQLNKKEIKELKKLIAECDNIDKESF